MRIYHESHNCPDRKRGDRFSSHEHKKTTCPNCLRYLESVRRADTMNQRGLKAVISSSMDADSKVTVAVVSTSPDQDANDRDRACPNR